MKSYQHTQPKIVTVPAANQPNLFIQGVRLEEAKSSKHLNKENLNFKKSQEFEEDLNDSKQFTFYNQSHINQLIDQNLKSDKNQNSKLLSKNQILSKLGVSQEFQGRENELDLIHYQSGQAHNKFELADELYEKMESKLARLKHQNDQLAQKRQEKMEYQELLRKQKEQEKQVILHDDDERVQMVTHHFSSLGNPNLENVEAELKAVHLRRKELEEKYKQKREQENYFQQILNKKQSEKGKKQQKQQQPEEFDYQDKQLKPSSSQQQYSYQQPPQQIKKKYDLDDIKIDDLNDYYKDLNQDIETKVRQPDKSFDYQDYLNTKQQFQQPKKISQQQQYEDDDDEDVQKISIKKQPSSGQQQKFNKKQSIQQQPSPKVKIQYPATQKKIKEKPNPKTYIQNYNNYKQEKKKQQEKQKEQKQNDQPYFDRYKCTSPNKKRSVSVRNRDNKSLKKVQSQNLFKEYEDDNQFNIQHKPKISKFEQFKQLMNSPSKRVIQKKQFDFNNEKLKKEITKNEMDLLTCFYDEMQPYDDKFVTKQDAAQFIQNNPKLMDLYNIKGNQLYKNLQAFPTENKTQLTFQEFVEFVKKNEEGQSSQDSLSNTCLLQDSHLKLMQKLFNELDIHEDLIVNRKQFIQKLKDNLQITKILHLPAVYLPHIKKTLILERVLQEIEQEGYRGDQDMQKSKEFISWSQFVAHFTSYKNMDGHTKEKVMILQVESNQKDKQIDENDIELHKDNLKIIQQIFDEHVDPETGFALVVQLVDAIRQNPKYFEMKRLLGRNKSVKYNLGAENIEQVINRIEQESDEYIDWNEFLDFFTRRGRPKHYMSKEQLLNEEKQRLAQPPNIDKNEMMLRSSKESFNKSPRSSQKNFFNQSQESFNSPSKQKNQSPKKNKYQQDQYEDQDEEQQQYQSGYDSDPTNLRHNNSNIKKKNNMSLSQNKIDQQQYAQEDEEQYQDHHQKQQKQYDRHYNDDNQYEEEQQQKRQSKYYTQEDEQNEDNYDEVDYNFDSANLYQEHPKRSQSENRVQYQQQQLEEDERDLNNKRIDYKSYGQQLEQKYNQSESKGHNKSKDRKQFTIPDPFDFDSREANKGKSIREQKLEEMVQEKLEELDQLQNFQFKAKEVPRHVNEPLFEQIMKDQEKRRQDVKKNSIQITLQREKPFTFYSRDKESKEREKQRLEQKFKEDPYKFKANPVPWYCSGAIMEKMHFEQEAKRKERIAKYAQQSMSLSKLPPRMEKHVKAKKAKEIREGRNQPVSGTSQNIGGNTSSQYDFTFKPEKRKEIPDFMALQQNFQNLLDKKRKSKKVTQPQPFDFEVSKKIVKREYMDIENQMTTKFKPSSGNYKVMMSKPVIQPSSTKKWEQALEKVKKEREEKDKQKQKQQAEDNERIRKREEFKKIVQGSYLIGEAVTEKKKAKIEEHKNKIKELKNEEIKQRELLKEIQEKVNNQPLMIERLQQRNDKLTEMKKVVEMVKILKEAGNKNYKKALTDEQRDLLDDYEYLKRNGYDLEKHQEQRKSQQEKQKSHKKMENEQKSKQQKKVIQ